MFPDLILPDPVPPLMDVADMRELLGLTGAASPTDTQLEFALNVATDVMRSYVGRTLVKADYGDKFIMVQANELISLSEYPLVSVTSITSNGSDVDITGLRYNARAGLLYPTNLSGGTEVVVTYEAGYDPIPFDLQNVLVELTRRQLQSMNLPSGSVTGDPPIKAVGIGNLRVDYAVAPTPDSARQLTSPVLSDVIEQFSDVLFPYRHSRMMAATG